ADVRRAPVAAVHARSGGPRDDVGAVGLGRARAVAVGSPVVAPRRGLHFARRAFRQVIQIDAPAGDPVGPAGGAGHVLLRHLLALGAYGARVERILHQRSRAAAIRRPSGRAAARARGLLLHPERRQRALVTQHGGAGEAGVGALGGGPGQRSADENG